MMKPFLLANFIGLVLMAGSSALLAEMNTSLSALVKSHTTILKHESTQKAAGIKSSSFFAFGIWSISSAIV